MELISEEAYEDSAAVALDGSAYYVHVTPLAAPEDESAAGPVESVSEGFRSTMRALASGVVLITTYVDGRPWGVTVTSCCSLSVEPPRILVSLMRNTVACEAIESGATFGAALLGHRHQRLAEFGAARGAPKFLDESRAVRARDGGVAPMVEGALSHVDCRVANVFDGGDHAIIVGDVIDVVSVHPHSSTSPLLYFDGSFHHLGAPL